MTLAFNDGYVSATATAGQTVFAYDFRLDAKTDLVVQQTLAGLLTVLLQADFEVSGLGNPNGGNVTLDTGAAVGTLVELIRETIPNRQADYAQAGAFNAVTVNADFDRQRMISQDLWREAEWLKTRADAIEADILALDAEAALAALAKSWAAPAASTITLGGTSQPLLAAANGRLIYEVTAGIANAEPLYIGKGVPAVVGVGDVVYPGQMFRSPYPPDADDRLALTIISATTGDAYTVRQKVIP